MPSNNNAAERKSFQRKSVKSTSYLFLLPTIAYLFIWMVIPLSMTIYYSFQKYNILLPYIHGFNGVTNYYQVFISSDFQASVINTLILVGVSLLFTIVLGILIALIYSTDFWGKNFARTLFITPFFAMPIVNGLLWKNMILNPTYGLSAWFERMIGISPISWLGSFPLLSIIIIVVWEWLPFSVLIFLTALQSVPETIIEAARIDGAGKLSEFFYIILPNIFQTIYVVLMLETMFFISIFAEIFVTTSGGPGLASTNLPYYIYLQGFFAWNVGKASAAAVITVIIANIIVLFFVNFLSKKLKFGGE
ncbi:MAG: sugar ABC transporter permease [Nitrososphaeria archaeon]